MNTKKTLLRIQSKLADVGLAIIKIGDMLNDVEADQGKYEGYCKANNKDFSCFPYGSSECRKFKDCTADSLRKGHCTTDYLMSCQPYGSNICTKSKRCNFNSLNQEKKKEVCKNCSFFMLRTYEDKYPNIPICQVDLAVVTCVNNPSRHSCFKYKEKK